MKVDAALIDGDRTQRASKRSCSRARGFAGTSSFEGQHDPFVLLVLAVVTNLVVSSSCTLPRLASS